MKNIKLKKHIINQIESVAATLRMLQDSRECDEETKKILTNQIGMLVFSIKEIEILEEDENIPFN